MQYFKRTYFIIVFSMLTFSTYGKSAHPNVLLIAIDDMNNWVGAVDGHAITPHIDALAVKGVLFDNAYCAVPACNPSRAAIFTGLRPEKTGQYGNKGNFRNKPSGADLITLQQYLQSFGYETVGAGKIFHHARGTGEEPNPISDPISWSIQRIGDIGTKGHEALLNDDGWAKWHDGELNGSNGHRYLGKFGVWGKCPEPKEETGDWKTADYCAEYLSKDHDKPFFLACGIFRPHSPQIAPQEFFDLYDPEKLPIPELPADDMDDVPEIAQRNFSSPFVETVLKYKQLSNAVHAYLASMSFADACVGHVLDALEQSPHKDNTIVVFWTDHGFQLAHKDRWEKYSLWRQGTQTPFIIYVPWMKDETGECTQAVSLIDIYPTVLDLLGLPKKEDLDGITLVPQLNNPGESREVPAVITLTSPFNHSIVHGKWNYIHYKDGTEELYDHENDLMEYHNLANHPEHRALMDRLKKWIPEETPEVRAWRMANPDAY